MSTMAQAPTGSAANSSAPTQSVLVVDDSSLCRELVCFALRGQGFAITSANDGQAGLDELEKRIPDVVVLDNEMPNMSGIDFLKAMRSSERWKHLPVVMLTASSAKEVILAARNLGICSYLLKDKFSMPEMLQRVRNALARGGAARNAGAGGAARPTTQPAGPKPEPVESKPPAVNKPTPSGPPAMTKAEIVKLPNLVKREATLAGVADIASAKSLAGVLAKVVEVTASPKANASDLAAVIKQDPIFAARVVQLAGSAAYAGSKARLAGVDDAVRIVGVSAIRDMAATIGVFSAFPRDEANGLDLLRCWQHSFAVAGIMGRIVPRNDEVPSGLGHLLGLCMDLSEILLRQKFPNEFSAALDYAEQASAPVEEMLAPIFGVTYSELVVSLLEQLKFPACILEPMRQYSAGPGVPVEAYAQLLPRSLAIANFMANGMLLTSSDKSLISPIPQNDCRSMLINGSEIDAAAIHDETITTVALLAGLGADQEAALSKPLIARRDVKIFYLRPPQFAPLDPLGAALRNLAEVEMQARLNKADQLADFDGMVLIAHTSGESHIPEAMRLRSHLGKELPVLILAPGLEGQEANGEYPGVTQSGYPLPISRLAQFISTIPNE